MNCPLTKIMSHYHNNLMNATTTSPTRRVLLHTAKRLPTRPLLLHHCAPLLRPLHCRPPPHPPPAPVMRTLMVHRVRLSSSSLVGAWGPTETNLCLLLIIGQVIARPLHLQTVKVERQGRPVSITRVVTIVSKAHPLEPKLIRAKGHTLKATAKKGKM